MRKIGLVGGTGPESTAMYYKELNSRIDKITNEKSMPDLTIESVNFRKAWNYVVAEQYTELTEYLSEKVNALKQGGSELIALTAGTMHIVIDEVENRTGVSLISIPKAVRDEILAKGYKKVCLLGTIFTMEKDYMKKDIEAAGIEIVIPDKSDRELIAKRIYEELEIGIVKESTLREFNNVLEKIRLETNVEAVILGCTELPLLLNNQNCILPCLDCADIHINKIINLAIGE